MIYLTTSKESVQFKESQIGGKAMGLVWLEKNKLNTPTWCVFSSFQVDGMLGAQKKVILSILKETNKNNLDTSVQKMTEIIKTIRPPDHFFDELQEWAGQNKLGPSASFAVRSSMIGEDGVSLSFAGQLESYLNIKLDGVFAALKKCILSGLTRRTLLYKMNNGIDISTFNMAVILQEMVFANQSGVSFTVNPNNQNQNELFISAAFGDCEGVVQGSSDCDSYVIDKTSGKVRRDIKSKSYFSSLITDEPTKTIESGKAEVSVLDDSQIKELSQKLLQIENKKSAPQDIEWAFTDKLYFFQVRPVTFKETATTSAFSLVFDNSNIQESYCGMTLPLTFSFASDCYRVVYNQLMLFMGFSPQEVQENNFRHSNMLSYVDGRVYYNINSWYQGLKFLPSFGRHKEEMEKMMGLEEPVDFVEDIHLTRLQKVKALPKLLAIATNLSVKFMNIDRIFNEFDQSFLKMHRHYLSKLDESMTSMQVIETVNEVKRNFLEKWAAPLVNDFYVMKSNGSVEKVLKKVGLEKELPHLISGEDLESIKPTYEIYKLAFKFKASKAYALLENIDESTFGKLKKDDPPLYSEVMDFVEVYGDRCIGELKLETVTYRQRPEKLLILIKNFAMSGEFVGHEKQRQLVEQKVFAKIRKELGFLSLWGFRRKLRALRKGVRYREHMRLHRTRVVGLFRNLYCTIGKDFFRRGVIENERDIFYLSTEEIERFICARSLTKDLKGLIEYRKSEFSCFSNKEPKFHFEAKFPFNENVEYFSDSKADQDKNQFQGLGCYPGVVEGEVEVLIDADETAQVSGKILCALRTDPGWAPLFPQVEALIVERGSSLSHSAVVAREMGIPTVVGVPGITRILKSGARVKIDGEKGTIEIIKKEESIGI